MEVSQGLVGSWPGPGECSPVAVVVIIVVTSQSSQTTQADGVGEKDLCSSIYPDLQEGTKKSAQREVRCEASLFSEAPIHTHPPKRLYKGITKLPYLLRNVVFFLGVLFLRTTWLNINILN